MTPQGGDLSPAAGLADGLEAALAAGGIGSWHWDAASGVVRWDRTLESLAGLEPGGFGGDYEAWLEQIHPEERDKIVSRVQDALDRGGSYHFEHRTVWPDGSVHWLECRGEVLTDAEGSSIGTVGCAFDVTQRKTSELRRNAVVEDLEEAAGRLRRLQRVSQPLASALTVEEVVAAVMEVLEVPENSNVRALWLMDPGTESLTLADHRNLVPASVEMFQQMPLDSPLPGPAAVRERRTVISPSTKDSVEQFPLLEGVPRSAAGFIAVPLVVEGEALGVIAFGYDEALDDGDVSFLEAASGHIAQTLKRVSLAEAVRQRTSEVAFLSDVTQAAIKSTDHASLMRSIAATAVPRLGEVCSIHFVPEPGSRAETAVVHVDPHVSSDEASRLLDTDGGGAERIATVLESGRPLLARSEGSDGSGATSVIAVPISGRKRVNGVLQILTTGSDRVQTVRDLALAHAVGAGIGEALEHRWVTDQHRQISTTLQRAFLPPALPEIANLDVSAVYLPAGSANVVGGDFYDMFTLGDHRWALVIGDACGTGPDAAAVATIARHTIRAAARHGHDHPTVLDWANQAIKHSDRNLFCTACYSTIHADPDEAVATVQLAAAGHPLPVLVTADGRAELLGQPGTLLGIFDAINTTTREVVLAPGDAVLFYTDGVTDLPDPDGLDPQALLRVFDDLPPGFTAEALIKHVRADLEARTAEHPRADDVALLVVRNAPG